MTNNAVCRAKNPSACRFHGDQGLRPVGSDQAYKELQAAIKAIPADVNDPKYFDAQLAAQEAEANYSITKRGLAETEVDFEKWDKEITTNSLDEAEHENAVAEYNRAFGKYSVTRWRRIAMLERYADSLLDKEFGSAVTVDRDFAQLAFLSNFAEFMKTDELRWELPANVSEEQFFQVISDSHFSSRVARVEREFVSAAKEIPLSAVDSAHADLRKRLGGKVTEKDILDGILLNRQDMLGVQD